MPEATQYLIRGGIDFAADPETVAGMPRVVQASGRAAARATMPD